MTLTSRATAALELDEEDVGVVQRDDRVLRRHAVSLEEVEPVLDPRPRSWRITCWHAGYLWRDA